MTCRSCHAPVVWAKTESGRSIPVDPGPSTKGNILIKDGIARVVPVGTPKAQTSHFATCPDAERWRR